MSRIATDQDETIREEKLIQKLEGFGLEFDEAVLEIRMLEFSLIPEGTPARIPPLLLECQEMPGDGEVQGILGDKPHFVMLDGGSLGFGTIPENVERIGGPESSLAIDRGGEADVLRGRRENLGG